MKKFKILTIFGTRPEIIRLSEVIKKLDFYFDHVLVNSNQNFENKLNKIFINNFRIRRPNYFFANTKKKFGISFITQLFDFVENILNIEKPDALVILGDTNTALSAYVAKKKNIKIFHIEAGNRSFDELVPEEINRRIIDNISDINVTYSNFARENLLRENNHPNNVVKLGSPLDEVLRVNKSKINKSTILKKLKLKKNKFYLCSIHRHENLNIKNKINLQNFFNFLNKLEFKSVMSYHPKTNAILNINKNTYKNIYFSKPFDYFDYIKLLMNAKAVFSDSGSITEEASLLKINAVSLRYSHERQEGFEEGITPLSLFQEKKIKEYINIFEKKKLFTNVNDYISPNFSDKFVKLLLSKL